MLFILYLGVIMYVFIYSYLARKNFKHINSVLFDNNDLSLTTLDKYLCSNSYQDIVFGCEKLYFRFYSD